MDILLNNIFQDTVKLGPESEKDSGLEKVEYMWNFPWRSNLSTSGGNPNNCCHQAVKKLPYSSL